MAEALIVIALVLTVVREAIKLAKVIIDRAKRNRRSYLKCTPKVELETIHLESTLGGTLFHEISDRNSAQSNRSSFV